MSDPADDTDSTTVPSSFEEVHATFQSIKAILVQLVGFNKDMVLGFQSLQLAVDALITTHPDPEAALQAFLENTAVSDEKILKAFAENMGPNAKQSLNSLLEHVKRGS